MRKSKLDELTGGTRAAMVEDAKREIAKTIAPLPRAEQKAMLGEMMREMNAKKTLIAADKQGLVKAEADLVELRRQIDGLHEEMRQVVRDAADKSADEYMKIIVPQIAAKKMPSDEIIAQARAFAREARPRVREGMKPEHLADDEEEWRIIEDTFEEEVIRAIDRKLTTDSVFSKEAAKMIEPLYPIAPGKLSEIQDEIAALEARHNSGEIDDATYEAIRDRMTRRVVGWKAAFCGLADNWTDQSLMAFGLQSWTAVREKYQKQHGEAPDLRSMQDGIVLGTREIYKTSSGSKREAAVTLALFAVTWASHAFQKVVTSHTYAAALMCSDAPREVLADVEVPWLAFEVVIPNGILTFGKVDYTRALVTVLPEPVVGLDATDDDPRVLMAGGDAVKACGATLVLYDPLCSDSEDGRLVVHRNRSLVELLFEEPDDWLGREVSNAPPPRSARCLKLAKRLIAGLILAMSNADNFKSRSVPARYGMKKREVGEPAHRITTIGRPISIDCRPAVHEYLTATGRKHGPPSVQTLVRGHHKRQVIGVRRSGRKVIWVEPYWRGPEDAPILTKPKRVA